MTWRTSVVDSTLSVAAHESRFNANASYIDTSMKVDHYWANANSNLDGHHQIVEMTAETSDPSLSTDMKGALYVKETDKALASDGTTDELWFRNGVAAEMLSGLQVKKYKNASLAGSGTDTIFSTAAKQTGYTVAWQADGTSGLVGSFWSTNDSGAFSASVSSVTSSDGNLRISTSGTNLQITNLAGSAKKIYSITWYSIIVE